MTLTVGSITSGTVIQIPFIGAPNQPTASGPTTMGQQLELACAGSQPQYPPVGVQPADVLCGKSVAIPKGAQLERVDVSVGLTRKEPCTSAPTGEETYTADQELPWHQCFFVAGNNVSNTVFADDAPLVDTKDNTVTTIVRALTLNQIRWDGSLRLKRPLYALQRQPDRQIDYNAGDSGAPLLKVLRSELQEKACVSIPSSWPATSAEAIQTRLHLTSPDAKLNAALASATWAIDDGRPCVQLGDDAYPKIVTESEAIIARDVSVRFEARFDNSKLSTLTIPKQTRSLRSARLLFHKSTVSNLPETAVEKLADEICVTPTTIPEEIPNTPPQPIYLNAKDFVLTDAIGRPLVSFSAASVAFMRRGGEFCAALTFDSGKTGSSGLVGTSTTTTINSDVVIQYQGKSVGTKAERSDAYGFWMIDSFRYSYLTVGVAMDFADTRTSSQMPKAALAVRMAVPLVGFRIGVPKSFGFDGDVGVAPGLVTGSESGGAVLGGSLSAYVGLSFRLAGAVAPRVGAALSSDLVLLKAPGSSDAVPGAQISALISIGGSAP